MLPWWYEGRGSSKTQAKNDASEKALRDLIIQKMVERPKKPTTGDANDTNDSDDVDMKDGDANSVEVAPKVSSDKTELPANYETMHPSMILSMMRANTQYVDLGSEGTTPNFVHRFGVTVDGQSFVGQDRTKKLARKAVAINACNTCFGTNFQQGEIRIVHVNKKDGDK